MRPGEGRTATKKPGTLVCGKWKIERVIRVTDQIASYEAKDPSGVKVHLKVLHPYKADDASLVVPTKTTASRSSATSGAALRTRLSSHSTSTAGRSLRS